MPPGGRGGGAPGGRGGGPSLAGARAGVAEAARLRGDEAEVIAARVQGQQQHAEAGPAGRLAAGVGSGEALQVLAAGAEDELRQAVGGIDVPRRVERGEALVLVDV